MSVPALGGGAFAFPFVPLNAGFLLVVGGGGCRVSTVELEALLFAEREEAAFGEESAVSLAEGDSFFIAVDGAVPPDAVEVVEGGLPASVFVQKLHCGVRQFQSVFGEIWA